MYIVQSSPKQATQPSRQAVTAADFGPSWQTKVELGLLSCSLPQLSSARSLAQRSQSARYIAYLLVSHKTELFVPHAKFVTKYGQNLFLAVFPFLVTYYAGITKKNIFGTTFLIGSNDFKLFGLASSLVSLMYVCGRVPRQLQNAAYIPSYHDIGNKEFFTYDVIFQTVKVRRDQKNRCGVFPCSIVFRFWHTGGYKIGS
jgi:hypothetical protein